MSMPLLRRYALLKRATASLAGLVAALVVANALYGWWMEQDWQLYRVTAKARGIVIDLPDEPRATVRPERNLAASGPFAPVTLDENGRPLPVQQLAFDWLPYDLLPRLALERRPDWDKVRDQLQTVSSGSEAEDATLTAAATLRMFDQKMGASWRAVLRAEAKPEASFDIQHWPLDRTRRMNYLNFRIAAQSHAIRAVALLEQGLSPQALEEIRGIIRLSDALRTEPSLICATLRAALLRIAVEPVWYGLVAARWTEAELAAIEELLAERPAGVDFTRSIDHERACINSLFEELLETSGLGRGRVLRGYFHPVRPSTIGAVDLSFSDGYLRSNQIFVNRFFDSIRQRIDSRGDLHIEHRSSVDADAAGRPEHLYHALATFLLPNCARAENRLVSVEARLRQARIAVAIERYRLRTNVLPSALGELVPELLRVSLADPFIGQEMRYRVDEDGQYRLWSVGADRDNDGAKPNPEDGISDAGDLVWMGPRMDILRTAVR
jgi:hypothetical protein